MQELNGGVACVLCVLREAAGEAVPGHAGGWPGLLPEQQELRQRPAGAGPPVLQGQDDGGGCHTSKGLYGS